MPAGGMRKDFAGVGVGGEVFVTVWRKVETCSAQELKSATKNSLYMSLASQNESPL